MSEDLITNTKWKSIPEKEREALMRLTMCARGECAMCKYEKDCNFDFQCKLATKNMNILADALRNAEPQKDECEACSYPINCEETVCQGCCRKRIAEQTEPQKIRCPKCGRSDYIREFGKDFSVTAEEAGFKYKCINCNAYIEPQTERSE